MPGRESPSTVPRDAVHLEAEAAIGLDSVVTLARGLGTEGTAERRLRFGPRPGLPEAPTKSHSQGSAQDRPLSVKEGSFPPGAARQRGPVMLGRVRLCHTGLFFKQLQAILSSDFS